MSIFSCVSVRMAVRNKPHAIHVDTTTGLSCLIFTLCCFFVLSNAFFNKSASLWQNPAWSKHFTVVLTQESKTRNETKDLAHFVCSLKRKSMGKATAADHCRQTVAQTANESSWFPTTVAAASSPAAWLHASWGNKDQRLSKRCYPAERNADSPAEHQPVFPGKNQVYLWSVFCENHPRTGCQWVKWDFLLWTYFAQHSRSLVTTIWNDKSSCCLKREKKTFGQQQKELKKNLQLPSSWSLTIKLFVFSTSPSIS